MFNQQELQVLLGGVNAPVDLDDLRANTHYGGVYGDDNPTIVAFWNVSGVPFMRADQVKRSTLSSRWPSRSIKSNAARCFGSSRAWGVRRCCKLPFCASAPGRF